MAEQAEKVIKIDPTGQFNIYPLFGEELQWFSISNATLWMALTVGVIALIMVGGSRGRAIIPSRSQSIAELAYGFVHDMIESVSGRDGLVFFPYIFTLFMFILVNNFLGLIPMSFANTSHIAVTAVLALSVFISITFIGFKRHGASFLKLFWQDSAPLVIRPALAVIELISYFVRPVSHSVRLAGNMTAGHAVLKVFAAFVGSSFLPVVPLAIIGIVGVYALETLVSFIQAYVFTILTCVYLKDALHPHH